MEGVRDCESEVLMMMMKDVGIRRDRELNR